MLICPKTLVTLTKYYVFWHLIWYACREWNENVAYHKEAIDLDKWDARWIPLWETRRYIHVKTYEIKLKLIFSTFKIRASRITTIWTLLVNYLPLLEAYMQPKEDEGDEDDDWPYQLLVNPIILLKSSTTHIVQEVVGSYHLLFCEWFYVPFPCH